MGAADLVGQVLLGKLRVEARLGEGGMGTVYRVLHLGTRHRRALKVMRPMREEEALLRFLREASVSGVLASPHIVETIDTGQLEDGSTYVLMELVDGEPLSRLFERGPVELGRIARLLSQACEGLAHAHDEGIVHRDLKPDNLMVVKDKSGAEQIKILDFGIARFITPEIGGELTEEGTVLGTPLYMAPEQLADAKSADARSDVYALGVILYEALSGRRPFEAASFFELVVQVSSGDYADLETLRPGLDPRVYTLVARTLARDPKERPQSVRELQAELDRFTATDAIDVLAATYASVSTRKEPEVRPSAPRKSGIQTVLVLVGAVVVIGAAISIGVWASSSPEPQQAPPIRPAPEPVVETAPIDAGSVEVAPPAPVVVEVPPRPAKRRPGALAGPEEVFRR